MIIDCPGLTFLHTLLSACCNLRTSSSPSILTFISACSFLCSLAYLQFCFFFFLCRQSTPPVYSFLVSVLCFFFLFFPLTGFVVIYTHILTLPMRVFFSFSYVLGVLNVPHILRSFITTGTVVLMFLLFSFFTLTCVIINFLILLYFLGGRKSGLGTSVSDKPTNEIFDNDEGCPSLNCSP